LLGIVRTGILECACMALTVTVDGTGNNPSIPPFLPPLIVLFFMNSARGNIQYGLLVSSSTHCQSVSHFTNTALQTIDTSYIFSPSIRCRSLTGFIELVRTHFLIPYHKLVIGDQQITLSHHWESTLDRSNPILSTPQTPIVALGRRLRLFQTLRSCKA
jgi:hypothetical protein